MQRQWEYVLQNLGKWQGSFTLIAANGEILEDIPSHISLTGTEDNKTIHLVLTRYYPITPGSSELEAKELVLDFSAPAAGAIFFETGAFSEGGIYASTLGRFGGEFCLVSPTKDRRLRIVQIFNETKEFSRLTLIREHRQGFDVPERPPLSLNDLVGHWQGQVVVMQPRSISSKTVNTETIFTITADQQLAQHCIIDGSDWIAASPMTVKGSKLHFEVNAMPYQTQLLPDGASSTCLDRIIPGKAFFMEVGWLLQPNKRQRLIRQYDNTGSWINVMLITEQRIA